MGGFGRGPGAQVVFTEIVPFHGGDCSVPNYIPQEPIHDTLQTNLPQDIMGSNISKQYPHNVQNPSLFSSDPFDLTGPALTVDIDYSFEDTLLINVSNFVS